ncbi:rhomboid family intramembrane serine protease [Salisediminibacterium selenitireducens]|uniref:Rhomboid family protein n=1 Tax=Bacillus selenitireducens (strain ATCC 700615 / DSM 15326 / MLS10) TaxID=439292 RepID=D6XXZ0_BACIE|nr:rhomboid family intramembrane serine protease [Salisediminibacterium selenitireducens]ADH98063.1 Rhomboid family protein [[Bacillus] selenitireducens MLS10]
MFLRNESFSEYISTYKAVSVLISICLFFYIWVYWFGFLGGNEIFALGVGWNFAIAMGEYWRLVTPIFLHGGLMHVMFNSFALFLFGPWLEAKLGISRFVMLFLGTAVIANIVTFLLQGPNYSHVGASGAIYGLFGVYLYIVLLRKDLMDQVSSQMIVTIIIIGVIMTFVNPGINILAHLFGLIAGAALAPLFLTGVSRWSNQLGSSNVHDPDDIGFDPKRWEKKRRIKEQLWFYIAGGAVAMIGFFWLIDTLFFS